MVLIPVAAVLTGCAADNSSAGLARQDRRGLEAAEASIGPRTGSAMPPAMLGNTPITWDDLRPAMIEAAGRAALEELVLDRMLSGEFEARGLTVTPQAIEDERRILMETLAEESGSSPDDAARLVEALRRTRGLGEARFSALLRRNAMLRALVRNRIQVDDDDVATAYAVRFGPRARSRLLVVPTERQAAELRSRLDPADPRLSMAFADLAARYSTDASAARGGSLPPLSLSDPAYPASARQALRGLKPGEKLTQPVSVPGGFAVFLLEEMVPASSAPPPAQVADQLRQQVRAARERVAMDDLARRTLASAPLRVHDPSLDAARSR
jgi:hypothetical protein